MLKQSDKNRVIFFDGYCNLCSFSIDFISAKNTESSFTFVPLQSKLALGLLTQNGYPVEKIKNLEPQRGIVIPKLFEDGNVGL